MRRRRITMILVVAAIFTLLTYSLGQTTRKESQQNSNEQPSKELLAKARGKKLLVKTLPPGAEGVELKDGTLRIRKGYEPVRQSNGLIALARAGDGAGTHENAVTVDCVCGFGGACNTVIAAGLVFCVSDKANACKGICELKVVIGHLGTSLIAY